MVAGANDAGFLRLTITGWSATNRDTLETGIRASVSETFETSWTLFQMRIENEILFGRDPTTGLAVNRNADSPTRRTASNWKRAGDSIRP